LQNFTAELFPERLGRRQIGKTPSKKDLAFSNNSPSMPRRNFSRCVKVHHSAAQFDFQFIASDNKLDDVGIFPLVCGRFLGHITTAAHSARGAIYCVADSAISLCRCICWCPTFVLQIATTRNAVFPYARRGPDTKQTSDAIPTKISIGAWPFIIQLEHPAVNSGGTPQVAPTK
jgi:hypothetical protein